MVNLCISFFHTHTLPNERLYLELETMMLEQKKKHLHQARIYCQLVMVKITDNLIMPLSCCLIMSLANCFMQCDTMGVDLCRSFCFLMNSVNRSPATQRMLMCGSHSWQTLHISKADSTRLFQGLQMPRWSRLQPAIRSSNTHAFPFLKSFQSYPPLWRHGSLEMLQLCSACRLHILE